jgi:hypothetical protein
MVLTELPSVRACEYHPNTKGCPQQKTKRGPFQEVMRHSCDWVDFRCLVVKH